MESSQHSKRQPFFARLFDKTRILNTPSAVVISSGDHWKNWVTESLKAQVQTTAKKYPAEFEDHPEDYQLLEDVYLKVPIVHGAINKTVDAVVGTGFHIDSDNEQASELLNMFIKDYNFDELLRGVVRDLLIYGTAFMEITADSKEIKSLRTVTPKYFYVHREKTGQLINYYQWLGGANKAIEFKPVQLLQFNHNIIGDKAYGTSLISPLIKAIEGQLQLEKDTLRLFTRKAGAPIHVQVGSPENPADNATLNAVKGQFQDMRNNQEYITSDEIKMSILSFEGKVMDPKSLLEYFQDQLVFGMEVPLVMLGKGNVPEGLAVAQQQTFERRVNSLQQAVEMVLENELFPRLLSMNGLAGSVEFSWDSPSEEENLQKVQALAQVLQLAGQGLISPQFASELQEEMRELLGFEGEDTTEASLQAPQPKIPTTQSFELHESVLDHQPLQEYVGFNFAEYLKSITEFIDSKDFEKRHFIAFNFKPGTSQQDWTEHRESYDLKEILGPKKLEKFREVLKEGFQEGKSIYKIQRDIINKVRPGDKIVDLGDDRELVIPEKVYSSMLARNEVIRSSNQGLLTNMEDAGIIKASWNASIDACPACADQDGKIFTIEEADERIPFHINCRCSWNAIRG